MAAAAIVASVFAQFEKLFDVEMPCFQIAAHSTLAFSPLVDGNGSVVDDLQERYNALALAVGAVNVSTERTNRCPIVAQSAAVFGEQRVFFDGIVNAAQVVANCSEEA